MNKGKRLLAINFFLILRASIKLSCKSTLIRICLSVVHGVLCGIICYKDSTETPKFTYLHVVSHEVVYLFVAGQGELPKVGRECHPCRRSRLPSFSDLDWLLLQMRVNLIKNVIACGIIAFPSLTDDDDVNTLSFLLLRVGFAL